MGKVERIIAGGLMIVGGILVGVFTGQWQLAFRIAVVGAGVLSSAFQAAPSMGDLNERQGAILENRVSSMERLPVIYGTVKIAGAFADVRVDSASRERKRLVIVNAFCHGSRDGSGVTAIDELWFDDRKVVNGSTTLAPYTTQVPDVTPVTRHLAYQYHLGTTTDIVDPRLNQLFPGEWPTTSKGLGVCYARLELWYNQDIYPGGIPNIQAKIRGNKVYDPRDATWKHSTNPALCIRDYLLSPIYGLGIPEAQLEDQSFIDMANYCDELVNIPGGGTQKRFEMNGWVDTSRSVEQNLAELCTSCRAQVVNEGDRWRMFIRRQRTVSGYKIDEKNTVEGSWQFILPGSEVAPNIGRASYVDPGRNYDVDTVQWPEPGQPNAYLTEDNSFEQRLEIDLPFTQNRLMAQQITMTLLKEAREAIGIICTMKEEAIQARIGELVEVSYPTPGWTNKTFDVAALLLGPDGTVRVVLVEYEPTVYDLDTQFAQPSIPNTDLPDPFTMVAPTSLVLVSQDQALIQQNLGQNGGTYTPRIRVTWSKSNDPFVDYYEIHARKAAGLDVTEVAAPFESTAFSHSGLTVFDATLVWNDVLSGQNAFGTDSAVANAWLQVDCGVGITKEFTEARIYANAAGSTANFTVQYSDNGSSWTDAVTGFIPSASGLNTARWASVGFHRYWRILLTNTPGVGPEFSELQFKEPAWDPFGRIPGLDAPLFYVYPVTIEQWQVRIRAVSKIGVTSTWVQATHLVAVPDPRPQILSVTLTNAHADTHSDVAHQDVAHGDSAHQDAHTDGPHTDHTDHNDSHGDSGAHDDAAHGDSHGDQGFIDTDHTDTHTDDPHSDHSDGHADSHTDSNHNDTAHQDTHGDQGAIDTDHTDAHTDEPHADHTDSNLSHSDVAHVDTHTDTGHSDSAHSDAHTDAHSDGQHGVGIAIQADGDSASVKAVARKHGDHSDGGHTDVTDATIAEVRTQPAVNGRNVVIELIDIATGAQILMDPGDRVRVGAVAYSQSGATGVEGPLALASVSMFTVAPVGTDKWVPT